MCFAEVSQSCYMTWLQIMICILIWYYLNEVQYNVPNSIHIAHKIRLHLVHVHVLYN